MYPTLATQWTVAHQAPLSMGFSRQEHWSGLPLPSPGDLPDPCIEPRSPTLQADTLPSKPPRKSNVYIYIYRASLVVQLVKNPPAMWENLGSIPGSGRSPGEGNSYTRQYLAWRIPWTAWSMESQRVGHDRATLTFRHIYKSQLTQGWLKCCRVIHENANNGYIWVVSNNLSFESESESCSLVSDSLWPSILQARMLEWVAFPFSRGSSRLKNWTQVSHIAGGFFTSWEPQGKPKNMGVCSLSLLQGIFPTQELNQGLLHCRRILYQRSYQGSPT